VFVANDIGADELAVAYGSIDFHAYYDEIALENGRKMATSVGDLLRLAAPGARIIDIGAGDGTFAGLLRDAGFADVSAHEIAGADLSGSSARGIMVYEDFDYSTIPSGYFDVVTLLDVAEHVRDPIVLMNACGRILKPGGKIYLHTPVVTRLDRLMHFTRKLPRIRRIGMMWQRGRTSVFHLENYTAKSLRLILDRAGFASQKVSLRNELSWPVSRYVRIYLLQKSGLPEGLAPFLAPFFYLLFATKMFNANKAVVTATRLA
jgi:SAM-dependent methyltransferase